MAIIAHPAKYAEHSIFEALGKNGQNEAPSDFGSECDVKSPK
jgi:hypothetical protein